MVTSTYRLISSKDDATVFAIYDRIRESLEAGGLTNEQISIQNNVSKGTVYAVSRAMRWPDLPDSSKESVRHTTERVLRWAQDRFGYEIFDDPQITSAKPARQRHFSVSLPSELADYVMIMSTALGMNSAQFLEMVTRMHRAKYEDKYQWLREVRGLGPEGGDQDGT